MGALCVSDPRFSLRGLRDHSQHGGVAEEIEGLIRMYQDGKVERHPVVPSVACGSTLEPDLGSRDATIDVHNGVWARFYLPKLQRKLPLLIYFHGGGFCVGSPAWKCYHEFLSKLASAANCIIMSVSYRLAPENHLPVAFEDGTSAVMWVRQQVIQRSDEQSWWWAWCNFSNVFIGGDSAGACLAYNVLPRLGSTPSLLSPLSLKGVVLIQPFFGGEARTMSESMEQPPKSALSLNASDAYWRMALPVGANRDHPWCNPLSKRSSRLGSLILPAALVCIAETDILKDRNMEFCTAMRREGKSVEQVVYKGVGHAFQVLHNAPLSRPRTHEMMSHIKAFINR